MILITSSGEFSFFSLFSIFIVSFFFSFISIKKEKKEKKREVGFFSCCLVLPCFFNRGACYSGLKTQKVDW